MQQRKTDPFFLHSLIRKVKTLTELKERLKDFSEEEIKVAVKTRAPDKSFPLEVARAVKIPFIEKIAIYHFLLPLTLQTDAPNFLTVVSPAEVLRELNCEANSAQADLIAIACEIINTVKKQITFSTSHPDSNFLSTEDMHQKNTEMETMRKETDLERNDLIFHEQNIFEQLTVDSYSIHLTPATFLKMLQTEVARSIHSKLGNCDELSNYGLLLMLQKYPQIRCGVFQIHNGDHVFLAINLPPNDAVDNPNVLICDIWAGRIFRGDQLAVKLRDLANVRGEVRKYSVLVNYDPKLQSIQPVYLNQRFFIYDDYYKKHCPTLSILKPLATKDQLYFLFYLRGKIRRLLQDKLITVNELVPFMNRLPFLRQLLTGDTLSLLEQKKIYLSQFNYLNEKQSLEIINSFQPAKKRRLSAVSNSSNLFLTRRAISYIFTKEEPEPKMQKGGSLNLEVKRPVEK